MKKIFIRIGVVGGTLVLIAAGAAAFSAFEAHVVNVTATISNALSVNPANLAFGTVFPEEQLNQNMTVALSDSFNATGRVDDVSYFLRQKPTCVDANGGFVQVTEVDGQYQCPAGSNPLPLLCPFISEHLGTTGGLDSFHGPLTGWTPATSLTFDQTGHLSKAGGDVTDNWNIDLNVPCFQGQCAQDNKVPSAYQLNPGTADQNMGCALWVEASGISACTVSNNQSVVSDATNTVETPAGNAVALSVINPGWTASIPGATWIWSTDPVLAPTTADDTKTFDKTFTVTGTFGTASLDIAADNFFTVYVNGLQIGSEQSNENNFQSGTQHNYVVTNLVTGSNTIKVVATNKGVANTDPASNPAGVLYKLNYTTTAPCKQ
jgi:hypothetical protein